MYNKKMFCKSFLGKMTGQLHGGKSVIRLSMFKITFYVLLLLAIRSLISVIAKLIM